MSLQYMLRREKVNEMIETYSSLASTTEQRVLVSSPKPFAEEKE